MKFVIPAKAGVQLTFLFLMALLPLPAYSGMAGDSPVQIKAALVESASEPDPAVRQAAARSLGETRNANALPLLARMLETDEDENVRLAALGALLVIGDSSAAAFYEKALKDESERVRRSAAEALKGIWNGTSEKALVEALRKDISFKVRLSAAESLGEPGPQHRIDDETEARSALIRALKEDESYQVRETAASVLVRFKDGRTVDAVVEAMDDKSVQVRAAAAESLGTFESPRAVDRLVEALSFEREDVVLEAAFRSLKYSNDPRVLQPAIRSLRSGNAMVRWAAIDALEALRSPDSVEPLKRVADDNYESEGVRAKAREALQLMGAE